MNHEKRSHPMSTPIMGAACILAGLLASYCLTAEEPAKKPADTEPRANDYPVKMAVAATRPDAEGRRQVVVTLLIEKGYHVFANPTGNEDLAFAQTTMKVTGKARVDAKVTYPKGEVVKNDVTGDYRVYRGKVTLKADVSRPKGDSGPLSVAVRVRPLDKMGCRWRERVLKEVVP